MSIRGPQYLKTNFERNRLAKFRHGGGAYVPPAVYYIGLFTVAPTVAGGGVEVAGGDYARAAINNDDASWADPAAGVVSNAVVVTFAQASALWGTAVYVGKFDALAGGNLLDFTPLTAPRTINPGDVFSFAIGQLQFTET